MRKTDTHEMKYHTYVEERGSKDFNLNAMTLASGVCFLINMVTCKITNSEFQAAGAVKPSESGIIDLDSNMVLVEEWLMVVLLIWLMWMQYLSYITCCQPATHKHTHTISTVLFHISFHPS